MNLLDSIQAP
jgi:brefeldin A-inhibited guanine nucleotide-exchange protein